MKRVLLTGVMAVLLAGLWACAPAVHTEADESQPLPPVTTALFDPAAGIIPFPNDLLINPATGLVNIPNPDGLDAIASVNSLDGFSTTSAITFYLDGAPKADTVNSDTVKLIDLITGQPVSVVFMPFDSTTGAISMVPVTPLKSRHKYAMVVTTGVLDSNNTPIEPSQVFYLMRSANSLVDENGHSVSSLLDDQTAAMLEPARLAMKPMFDFMASIGIPRTSIAVASVFTTESIYQDYQTLRAQLAGMAPPAPVFAGQYLGDAMVGAFYQGVMAQTGIDFPHDAVGGVLTGAFGSPNYISNPLVGYFMKDAQGNFVEQNVAMVPFILVVPKGPGPFPVVIFQHGFTRTKMDALAIANTFASAGMATISMDLVLHGDRAGDYMNNSTGEMVPDGQLDPSGALFLNLKSLRTSRDNIRQSNVDQMMMVKMLQAGVDYTGDGNPDLVPMNFVYCGQSLGAMTGTNLMAIEPAIKTAVLNVPGGIITQLLINSPTFGPVINAGLAAEGLTPGSPEYNQFFLMTQTVIDSADPVNYAPHVLNGDICGVDKYVLMQEAIGDTVVPNVAGDAEARAFGPDFPQVKPIVHAISGMTTADPGVASGLFQFDTPNHGFLLAPDPSNPQFTYYGQLQTVNYLGSYLMTGTPMILDPAATKGVGAAADTASEWALRTFNYSINAKAAVLVR
ncbi:MAG: hypothetical protein GXO69_06950 [Acidobacteria bacterium]|nr:hypothetical protein [Acidobacteriota bacterium]